MCTYWPNKLPVWPKKVNLLAQTVDFFKEKQCWAQQVVLGRTSRLVDQHSRHALPNKSTFDGVSVGFSIRENCFFCFGMGVYLFFLGGGRSSQTKQLLNNTGTGTSGRRNWPEPNRTVGFLNLLGQKSRQALPAAAESRGKGMTDYRIRRSD